MSAPGAGPGPREERGTADGSRLHPPHVDTNAREEGDGVPTLPANAHGRDRAEGGEHPHAIDEESMYDRRPEEHKDH